MEIQRVYEKLDIIQTKLESLSVGMARIEEQNISCYKEREEHSKDINYLKQQDSKSKGGIKAAVYLVGVIITVIEVLVHFIK